MTHLSHQTWLKPRHICGQRKRTATYEKSLSIHNLGTFYFTNRTVNIWNSLPNFVVPANTINMFKTDSMNFVKTRI